MPAHGGWAALTVMCVNTRSKGAENNHHKLMGIGKDLMDRIEWVVKPSIIFLVFLALPTANGREK